MKIFQKTADILGMNARNLLYISRYNSAANKKFADDKLYTKRFLESRGIGVAKLFHQVKTYDQLTDSFFASLPESFVIKPNKGFAGGGILVIMRKQGDQWVGANGKKYTQQALFRHCVEILEGKYSISGVGDTALFEERLITHDAFRQICDLGLPDIRVIVFNMVPVLAMLRVPTHASDGKANMELGAVALGIDIGTGKTTGGSLKSKYIKRMPNGVSAVNFQIPYWDAILNTVSRIQKSTHIGYLGVDIVICNDGIKVLELNARSGLKIQVANKTGIRNRLKAVEGMRITSPEEAVTLAKKLFTQKSGSELITKTKPSLGIKEPAVLHMERPQDIIAKIDLLADMSTINVDEFEGSLADISIADKRMKIPVKQGEIKDADIIIAGKHLTQFVIDPQKPYVPKITSTIKQIDEQMIQTFDQKIASIAEEIKLLSYINPRNIADQKELFFADPDFEPRFYYRKMELPIDTYRRDLQRLPEIDHPLYPLFHARREELLATLTLLESIGTPEMTQASEAVFGAVTNYAARQALEYIKKAQPIAPDKSKLLNTKEAEASIKAYLKANKLNHWSVSYVEDGVVDIQVTKKQKIILKKGAQFRFNRLEALLIHEIGTHVFRFENGRRQPYRIFERGSAGYLRTEEGLAFYNQESLGINLGQKHITSPLHVVTIHQAKTMGFRDLFNWLQEHYQLDDEEAWKHCIKVKRGTQDPSKPGAFTKDAIYFMGFRDLQKYLNRGGKLYDLYYGKISVSDVKYLEHFPKLVAPVFVPENVIE